MPTPSSRRKIAALLLVATVLAASPGLAAGLLPETPRPVRSIEEALNRAWAFFSKIWTKEGCNIDPDGRCIPAPTPPPVQGKVGCNIDPNGQCL